MTNLNATSDDHAGTGSDNASDGCSSELRPYQKAASSTELAELLYLLKLGVKTNLRWIGRERPDIDAARKTSARLCVYVDRLESLIASTNPNCSERL
ncbi:hypothetical protein ACI2J4_12515 [Agrobacterium tumefaciens]|uniref:hypothetical protein n=1 Tax=Agrobacterium TaxID=357 RepID=UPI0028A7F903|nr:hypothetical protein [Agrobacterium cavarae]